MRILFKSLRSSEDLIRMFNFCEYHGIETLHNDSPVVLDDIRLEDNSGVINWGGYGSRFGIGKNLFNYFKLEYPKGDPPSSKNYTHVKMVLSGDLKKLDAEKVVQQVIKLGGIVVRDVDDTVNLLVTGKQPDARLVAKAVKLNQVLIISEERFIEILPAKRKKPAKRKLKPRKALPKTVDKDTLSNLNKMFKSRDKDRIDLGHELLRSLENADICTYYLEGVSNSPNRGNLILNSMFTGTGPEQPYLNYALMGIIAYAPQDCAAAISLKKSITQLVIKLINAEPLAEFVNLESLDLTDSTELEDLDAFASLKKLKHINITNWKKLKNLKGLLHKTLDSTYLDLRGFNNLENLNGIQSMQKLEEIVIGGCNSLTNIDALKNLTSLKNIYFDNLDKSERNRGWSTSNDVKNIESIEGIQCLGNNAIQLDLTNLDALKSLNGIQNLQKLEVLSVSGEKLSDISALKGLQSLKKLKIGRNNLQNLKGIEMLPKLEELEIQGECLNSLSYLRDLPSLKSLTCSNLADLSGIVGAPNIIELNLLRHPIKYNSDAINNIIPLKKLSYLQNLTLQCTVLENLNGLEQLKNLKSISLIDCFSLISLNGIPNPEVFGKYIDFRNCSSLQDIRALKGLSNIETLNLSGCNSIQNTEGLENIEIEEISIEKPNIKQLNSFRNLNVKSLSLAELEMPSLKGLDVWESITNLEIQQASYTEENTELIKSLSGIEAFINLEKLSMCSEFSSSNACDRLENLMGVEKLQHLQELDLTGCFAIKDVSSVAELPNLSILKMDGCKQADPLPRPKVMDNREKVEKYQIRLLKALGKTVPEPAKKALNKEKPAIDRKTFTKIKKLLTTRDYDKINIGLELVSSLEEPLLYQEFLDGVQYEIKTYLQSWGSKSSKEVGELIPNNIFKGTGPAQPYLDYAMLRLINDAPNDFAVEIRKGIRILSVDTIGDYSEFTNLEKLTVNASVYEPVPTLKNVSVFNKLSHLEISSGPKNDQNLKALSSLIKLNTLILNNVPSLETLNGIEKCSQLNSIEINDCNALINIDALTGCKQLESILLTDAKNLMHLDGLKGLKRLKSINIDGVESLESLDGLEGSDSLEELVIQGGYEQGTPIKDIDALKGLKMLWFVDFYYFNSLLNLDGFNGCSALEELRVDSESLVQIDGLKNIKSLKNIQITAKQLKNIDGLTGCDNLEYFNIESEAMENLDGLKGCKLEELKIPSPSALINLDAFACMDSLHKINFDGSNFVNFGFSVDIPSITEVIIRGCHELKSLKGIEHLINIKKLTIIECNKFTSLDGLKDVNHLEEFIIKDCLMFKDVNALLILPNLKLFKMRSCAIKKADLPAELKAFVDTSA